MARIMWLKSKGRLATPEEQFEIETDLGLSHIGIPPTSSIGEAKAEGQAAAKKKQ